MFAQVDAPHSTRGDSLEDLVVSDGEAAPTSLEEVFGLEAREHSLLNHPARQLRRLGRQAAFGTTYDKLYLPNVERICKEVIALPLYPEMDDALLSHEGSVTAVELGNIAERLGLDIERFWAELRRREYAPRVARDVASADASDVSGTPTFFINGRRHRGAYDIESLTVAARAALRRARVRTP